MSVPAAARAHTEEGAKAFAEHYLKTYSEAAVRADSAPLAALSDPSCGGCGSLIDLIDEYRANGQRVAKRSLTVNEVAIRPEGTQESPIIDVLAKEARKQILNRDGSVAKNVAGANINFRLTLIWTEDSWSLRDLRIIR